MNDDRPRRPKERTDSGEEGQRRPQELAKALAADIGHILAAFEEQYESSLIRNKFALDTSEATVEQTLGQFVEQVEPFLADTDRLRMLTRSLPPTR